VLYSLSTGQGEGYVYALIEHQSVPDKHMAFRLVRYAIAAMQRHLQAGHDQLPLVIPILFYHGLITPYPYSLSWLEGFTEPDLARQLYTGHFPLVDVTVIPDDEIMKHRRMAILELLQKHVRQRDLAELLEQLVTLLLAGYTTKEQLISLVNYMLQVGKATEPEKLLRELARRAPRHEEELMTIAEYLEQKGFEKGLEKERETVLKIASSMLAEGFDRAMVMKLTGLSADDLAVIHR
jgi:predicted transposase/invertase (TIGR01784 family)